MSNNYIDNEMFFKEMSKWKSEVVEAEEAGDKKPPVTEYIGECFWKIAEHLSHKANFINYPFRDDMIGDAIENCIMYAHNFNPDKSKNPFSYFTQITYYAFIRRIEKEKKQNYIKYKLVEELDKDGKVKNVLFEKYADDDKDKMAQYFSLSKNDIEKFNSNGKKKKK
mgnify:CR=1 FL=1|tara:strand:+ start:121 stop:621 length:501 start_codon:yes stop_codon:yes gene_type:complete